MIAQLRPTIAVIFDFDDTLVPDSTTKLLREKAINPERFWEEVDDLTCQGFDKTLAYLKLLLNYFGEDKRQGALTRKSLRKFGTSLEDKFYPGIPAIFHDIKRRVKKSKDINVEFYIISGGLREIIMGSKTIQKNFAEVYGSELAGETDDKNEVLRHIKRAITFTEKTRYLFEINKGITREEANRNPYAVNRYVEEKDRPIPFHNMIYIGDGLTDIPCFSLIEKNGGLSFGIRHPTKRESADPRLQELVSRVKSLHLPNYSKQKTLYTQLLLAVETRCACIQLDRG